MLLTQGDWDQFVNIMSEANVTFGQKTIIWRRQINQTNLFGEQVSRPPEPISLLGLVNYNYMRTWPSTAISESGETDEQSCQIFFNKVYLAKLGYINNEGYFNYNTDFDTFTIDGLNYKSFGDTAASQTNSEDIFILLTLKRIKTNTGDSR
jgi:hypothetical protein